MKINNDSFSFRRIALLVRRDVVENWKGLLWGCLSMTVAFLLVMYMDVEDFERHIQSFVPTGCNSYCLNFDVYERCLYSTMGGCKYVLGILFFMSASLVMNCMSAKGGRVNFLMIPARNREKFLARSVYVTVYPCISAVVGFVLADMLRMILFPMLGYYQGAFESLQRSLLPGLFEMKLFKLFLVNQWGKWGGTFALSMAVCAHSLFILGGTYWRKHAFLKTLGLILIIFFGGAYLLWLFITYVHIEGNPPQWLSSFVSSIAAPNYDLFVLRWAFVFFAWTIFNWYWAYRLFCRSQVVEPKCFSR